MGCGSYRGKRANERKSETRSCGRHREPGSSQPIRGACAYEAGVFVRCPVFSPATPSGAPGLSRTWEGGG